MKKDKLIEVRFHSRGGQGGVTAAKLLAMAAFIEGKHCSAFSVYGAERRGSPTVSFARISNEPIKIYSSITHPDCVVIMDSSLMEEENKEEAKEEKKVTSIVSCTIHPKDGLEEDGKIVLNSDHFWQSNRFAVHGNKIEQGFELYDVYAVNATKIALDLGLKVAGAPILNVPILGAIAKTGIVKLYSVKKAIAAIFPDKRNEKAVEIAYKEVKREKW